MRSLSILLAALVTLPAHSELYAVGNWNLDIEADYTEAYTTNRSGSVLGMVCLATKCYWYTNLKIACKPGSEYPALINARHGSFAAHLRCFHLQRDSGERHVFVITEYDSMEQSVNTGGTLCIVIAMQSGEFNVARFDTDDGSKAVQRAAAAAARINGIGRRAGSQRM
jgi:hypothetical protein